MSQDKKLPLFEAARPDDRRPREAIAQIRAWTRGEVGMMQSRAAGGHAMEAARAERAQDEARTNVRPLRRDR